MAMTDPCSFFHFSKLYTFFRNLLNIIQFQVLGNILTMNGEIITWSLKTAKLLQIVAVQSRKLELRVFHKHSRFQKTNRSRAESTIACDIIRFSSLFAAGDVSRGPISASEDSGQILGHQRRAKINGCFRGLSQQSQAQTNSRWSRSKFKFEYPTHDELGFLESKYMLQ